MSVSGFDGNGRSAFTFDRNAGETDLKRSRWRKQATVEDLKTGPKASRSTVLSEAEEAMIIAFPSSGRRVRIFVETGRQRYRRVDGQYFERAGGGRVAEGLVDPQSDRPACGHVIFFKVIGDEFSGGDSAP